MSLKHALLGFTDWGPMTGYELKKFFDTSVAHFWNSELSHIYPALRTMEAEGLVEMTVDFQKDRPNRKVYSITEAGRQELRQWLATPAEPEQLREPLMIKVFFGSSLPKEELLAVLLNVADRVKQELEYHKYALAFMQRFAAEIGLDERDAFFCGLTIDAGIDHYSSTLNWIEKTIRKIESFSESEFPPHARQDHPIDSRTAMAILERITSVFPRAAFQRGR